MNIRQLESTSELSRKLQAAEVGTLKIAATYAMKAAYIPESIAAFHHHRPLADIQLMALPPRQIIDLVTARDLDAGFLYEPVSDNSKVSRIPLCDVDIVCALPSQHHLASKETITAHDLAGETLISFSEAAYGAIQVVLVPCLANSNTYLRRLDLPCGVAHPRDSYGYRCGGRLA